MKHSCMSPLAIVPLLLEADSRPGCAQVLDQALLRPGRFDRQVTVDRPDVQGRVRVLKVHSRGKSIGKDVDFDKVARRTPGEPSSRCLSKLAVQSCTAVLCGHAVLQITGSTVQAAHEAVPLQPWPLQQ